MDYAPSVTHWCLGRRCLEPADAQDVTHLRNLILQHTQARYQADRQLFPPEQYLWANGLTRDGAWRNMRSSEKESAMGFPEGFTLSAWLTSDATRAGVRALST